MLNAAMWAKIAKAIIAVGAVAGIQIEPDQLELIAQARAVCWPSCTPSKHG